MLAPVPRNVGPATQPHAVVFSDMIEKSAQRERPASSSGNPHMETDRHHFGRRRSFLIKHVKGLDQRFREILGRSVSRRGGELTVVEIQVVRDNEMRRLADPDPIG